MANGIAVMRGRAGNLTALAVAIALAFPTVTPAPARAGSDDLVKALLVIGAICMVSGACAGSSKPAARRATRAAPPTYRGHRQASDIAALNRSQRRLVQEGLASAGFYSGAIDGAFGRGTRRSIRAYQASVGAAVTGVLTGTQINALAALSPAYASLPPDNPMLFGAVLVRDTDHRELRRIQARLNALGHDAGAVDGAMGRRTRAAIAAFMADRGLPGAPLASQRLLAWLNAAPDRAGDRRLVLLDGDADVQPLAGARARTLAPETPASVGKPVETLQFDVLGMRPGMSRRAIESMAAERLEGDIHIATGTAAQFGGAGALTLALAISEDAWPAPGSQQITALFDAGAPGDGAVAVFRTVIMPADVSAADFIRETVPALIDAYGRDGLVDGALTWVGDGPARVRARDDAGALAACGALRLVDLPLTTPGDRVGWEDGTAPRLETASIGSVTAACGDVLKVGFDGAVIRFSLWDADRLVAPSGAPETPKVAKLPKIEF